MVTPISQRSLRGGELPFTVVVIAGYVVMFTTYGYPLYAPGSLTLIVLGAIYLGIGLYGSRLVNEKAQRSPWLVWVYFLVELLLGAYIIYAGRGGAWMIVLPLVGTAVELMPRRLAILACVLVWFSMVIPSYLLAGPTNSLGWGMAFLSAILFVAVFTQVAVNEQKARAELAAVNQKLREYAAQAEELAVAQERNRLAREIHDGLGHYLTAINIQLKAAQAVSSQDPATASEALANAQNLTEEALADVRRSISALRADPSTNRPLPETLSRLLADLRAAGVQADFSVEGQPRPLPAQVDFTLYRAAQEGLTNVSKHSQATHVELALEYLRACRPLEPARQRRRQPAAWGWFWPGGAARTRPAGGWQPAGQYGARPGIFDRSQYSGMKETMPKERIRLLLVDDQTMFRQGMRVLLSTQPDFEVVGEAADGEEALQRPPRCARRWS